MIEFSYSAILKKHTVRTKSIEIKGRGVKQHHSQKEGKPFNVYSLSRSAFAKLREEHPNAKHF